MTDSGTGSAPNTSGSSEGTSALESTLNSSGVSITLGAYYEQQRALMARARDTLNEVLNLQSHDQVSLSPKWPF